MLVCGEERAKFNYGPVFQIHISVFHRLFIYFPRLTSFLKSFICFDFHRICNMRKMTKRLLKGQKNLAASFKNDLRHHQYSMATSLTLKLLFTVNKKLRDQVNGMWERESNT